MPSLPTVDPFSTLRKEFSSHSRTPSTALTKDTSRRGERPCLSLHCIIKLALPNAVENVSIGKDSDVEVGLDDLVEVALLLIAEEGVGHPHLARVRQGKVANSTYTRQTDINTTDRERERS